MEGDRQNYVYASNTSAYGDVVLRFTHFSHRSIEWLEAELEWINYLDPHEHRSIVAGLTTALGYLGDWEPILTHLSPGEPWLHRAGVNVFDKWVPGPLAAEPANEQERAARWILRRLRDNPNLPAQVRSTLNQIKDRLEIKLGRHITG